MKNVIHPSATLFSLLVCFFSFQVLTAQNSESMVIAHSLKHDKSEATTYIAKPANKIDFHSASFKGFQEYAASHLTYPSDARANAIEGKVGAIAEISPEGKVTDVRVVEPLGHGCSEAVVNMLRQMPNWKPAIRNGVSVATSLRLNFTFKLEYDGF